MKKILLLSIALILFCMIPAHTFAQDDKPSSPWWKTFKGLLHVWVAVRLHAQLPIYHYQSDFARTALIGGIGVKGICHILKSLSDLDQKNLSKDGYRKSSKFFDMLYNCSVISVGVGAVGYLPTTDNDQYGTFWNEILSSLVMYWGGCFAYAFFDKEA